MYLTWRKTNNWILQNTIRQKCEKLCSILPQTSILFFPKISRCNSEVWKSNKHSVTYFFTSCHFLYHFQFSSCCVNCDAHIKNKKIKEDDEFDQKVLIWIKRPFLKSVPSQMWSQNKQHGFIFRAVSKYLASQIWWHHWNSWGLTGKVFKICDRWDSAPMDSAWSWHPGGQTCSDPKKTRDLKLTFEVLHQENMKQKMKDFRVPKTEDKTPECSLVTGFCSPQKTLPHHTSNDDRWQCSPKRNFVLDSSSSTVKQRSWHHHYGGAVVTV